MDLITAYQHSPKELKTIRLETSNESPLKTVQIVPIFFTLSFYSTVIFLSSSWSGITSFLEKYLGYCKKGDAASKSLSSVRRDEMSFVKVICQPSSP